MIDITGVQHECGIDQIVEVETLQGSFKGATHKAYDAMLHICVCEKCGAILVLEGQHLPYTGQHLHPLDNSGVFQMAKAHIDSLNRKGGA